MREHETRLKSILRQRKDRGGHLASARVLKYGANNLDQSEANLRDTSESSQTLRVWMHHLEVNIVHVCANKMLFDTLLRQHQQEQKEPPSTQCLFCSGTQRERQGPSQTHPWKFPVPQPTRTWSQKSPGQTSTCNDVFDVNASSSVRGKASLRLSTSFTEAQNAEFLRWRPNGVQYVGLIDTPRPQLVTRTVSRRTQRVSGANKETGTTASPSISWLFHCTGWVCQA